MSAPRVRFFVDYNVGLPEKSRVYGVYVGEQIDDHRMKGTLVESPHRVVRFGVHEGYDLKANAQVELAKALYADVASTIASSARIKQTADALRIEIGVDEVTINELAGGKA
jgi:hypothetical protein